MKKNWLTNIKTIALPVYFMVLNFDYDFQLLSIIHVCKYFLVPVTFYASVVTLRGGGIDGDRNRVSSQIR